MSETHKIALHRQRSATPRIRTIGQKRTVQGDFYHYILGHGWLPLLGIVAAAFLGTNALFGAAYLLEPGSIARARPGSFADAFFFSVDTMATIGYGEMAPATPATATGSKTSYWVLGLRMSSPRCRTGRG
jgi:inward rectifier potassium channel